MVFRATAISIAMAFPVLLSTILSAAPDAKASETWHHLTPAQRQKILQTLAPTDLRPAAPAYLPPGFRVILAEADASTRYANGDYDAGFRIEVRGPDNQCFGLSETKSGARGLQKITTVPSAIGSIAIYRDPHSTVEKSGSRLVAFLPAEARIFLITPDYGKENPDGTITSCEPISLPQFLKVAESLRWLKE